MTDQSRPCPCRSEGLGSADYGQRTSQVERTASTKALRQDRADLRSSVPSAK